LLAISPLYDAADRHLPAGVNAALGSQPLAQTRFFASRDGGSRLLNTAPGVQFGAGFSDAARSA
jgi:hypothetical protein